MKNETIVRIRGGLATTVAAMLGLLLAPAAFAQLPGNSAVDQYTENVPAAGGDQSSGDVGGGGSSSSNSGGGPPSNAGNAPSDTEAAGVDGGAAGGLAEPTVPDVSPVASEEAGRGNDGNTSAGDDGPESKEPTSPAVDTTSESASEPGDGGVGVGLPIVLGVLVAGTVGFVLYRRRQGAGKGPAAVRTPHTS